MPCDERPELLVEERVAQPGRDAEREDGLERGVDARDAYLAAAERDGVVEPQVVAERQRVAEMAEAIGKGRQFVDLAVNVDAVRPAEVSLSPTSEKGTIGLHHDHRVVATTQDIDPILCIARHIHHSTRRAQACELEVRGYPGPAIHALILPLPLSQDHGCLLLL